jgi:hypothetical protein
MARVGAVTASLTVDGARRGGLCGPKDHYTSNLAPKPILTMRAVDSFDGSAARAQAPPMPPAGAC